MATTIKLKNSVTTTNAPSSLAQGEVAINITDKKVWVGNAATTPIQLLGDGGSATFSSITVTGVSTFSAGTVSAPSITTSGDTNTGIYFPAADTIAFTEGGVEAMRIDSSGNVGIGTSSPSSKLVVKTGTNQNLHFRAGGDVGGTGIALDALNDAVNGVVDLTLRGTNLLLISHGATPMAFNTNGSERMRIDSSGNVGIGTSSPTASRLHLAGYNGGTTYPIRMTSSNSGVEWAFETGGSASNSSFLAFRDMGNSAERMRITSDGNLGLGTTSPNKGGVSRALTLNGTAGNIVEFCVSDTRVGWVYGDNNLTALSAGGSRYIALETNGSERMRITSGGELLVGTTGTGSYQDGRLNVISASTLPAAGFKNTGLASQKTVFVWNNADSGTRNLVGFVVSGSPSEVGSITSNGSSTTYGTSSDYRLKENIAPMTDALEKVAQLKPVTYTWKNTGINDSGFIAHELQEICPNAVTGEKDAVDSEGNPVYQGVDTSFLVATLTAAIQELNAKVEAQAAEIALLKSK
jgi:hypothetical protein